MPQLSWYQSLPTFVFHESSLQMWIDHSLRGRVASEPNVALKCFMVPLFLLLKCWLVVCCLWTAVNPVMSYFEAQLVQERNNLDQINEMKGYCFISLGSSNPKTKLNQELHQVYHPTSYDDALFNCVYIMLIKGLVLWNII